MTITKQNYEPFLIDYLHGELAQPLEEEMKEFLSRHADVQEEYELLKQTILTPDEDIVFERKDILMKPEGGSTVWMSYKRTMAIAASIVALIGITYLFMPKNTNDPSVVAKDRQDTVTTNIAKIEPKNETVEEIQPVKEETITPVVVTNPKKEHSKIQKPSSVQIVARQVAKQPKQNTPKRLYPKPENNSAEPQIAHQPKPQEPEITLPETQQPQQEKQIAIQQTPKPKPEPVQEKEEWVANQSSNSGAIELDAKKQPRLFKAINKTLAFLDKVKKTKEQVQHAEVAIVLGNRVVFNNINN